ncbi:DNA polymerase III subunit chi [Zestomonas carbonaria]|uniref:DNA polymerase III subunit chi n=1 Tax=Zestomonas carbonaria TaxID=2762745 RepID=A0A7U7EN31_9GAMM|nr:DNA polymerase III subunit chi [Pseudomonas carbonaria]CAD5108017.1 hypothetical protein PSEWESI4_02300 [Pseudomonas carbonaria]
MDTPKPPIKPAHLLDDLESIRQLLDEEGLEPPLLTETVTTDDIPLLSEIIEESAPEPDEPAIGADRERQRLDNELRAAAQLILQDVIDDFVPQIEAELKRRLEARLGRLINRKP